MTFTVVGHPPVTVHDPDESLLEILEAAAIPVATACGGVAMCGTCRVVVVAGSGRLTPIKPREHDHLTDADRALGVRLACQTRLIDSPRMTTPNLVIRLAPLSQTELAAGCPTLAE